MKWFLALMLVTAFAKGHSGKAKKANAPKKAFPSKVHLTKVESCKTPAGDDAAKDSRKKVMVLKQWHLAPTTSTKGFKEKYPQEKNQTAIYKVLEEGVKRGELQLIVSEGCEGEINSEFKTPFNGWDYDSLKAQCFQKNYDKILTLVPLKIEAKYGDKIPTFCGDNEKLIQEGNLRLSNLRGWSGFFTRINEVKGDPEKIRSYAESAADLLKLPKDTPTDKIIAEIKTRIKVELEGFNKSLADRNDDFVKTLSNHDFSRAAIVVGGLHAEDLKEKLEKAGMACDIYEPPGYQREDESLIRAFEKAL